MVAFANPPNVRVFQAEFFGADSGTNANVTKTTEAIQTALYSCYENGGGTVTLTEPGVYYINATLTIYSDTCFHCGPGVTIKMASGAGGKPVLQNYAFSQRASPATVTLSWSSGMTAAISGWTGHDCEVGDYVYLQGATLSCYNIVGYLSAADSSAGTATVRLLRLPSGAVSGTITALKCDRNITIQGGIFDYNYPDNTTGGTTGPNACCVNLGIVQNLVLRDVQSTDALKYSFLTMAVRDMIAENCGTPFNNSDFFKIFGPAVNCAVRDSWGYCGDDGISVQVKVPAAYPLFVLSEGDCINVHIDGVDLHSTLSGAALVTFYPSDDNVMIGMKASRVGGSTNAGQAVKIFGEHSSADIVDSLEVDTVTASALDAFRIVETGGTAGVKNLIIRNLQPQLQTTAATAVRLDGDCIIETADIGIVINDSAFGGSGVQYAAVFNGTWYDVRLRGKINGGTFGRFFNPISQTASAVGKTTISIDQRTGDNTVVIPSTTAAGGVFVFEDCDTTTAAVVNPATNCTLIFNGNNKFHNASNGVVRPTGTPTFDVRSGGGNKLTGTSVWVVVPSGTPVMTFYGWDISIDPIALTGVALTVGQYITSTQSGNEAGAAVCGNVNGTPAWYALAGAASGANAAIT